MAMRDMRVRRLTWRFQTKTAGRVAKITSVMILTPEEFGLAESPCERVEVLQELKSPMAVNVARE